MRIALVAAVAENGVIGADGDMPWHYPADLKRFRELTMGSPVVMGRRTYESIERELGGPLPGRTNVVLSRQSSLELPEGAVHARSVEEALELAEAAADEPGTDRTMSDRVTDRTVTDRTVTDRTVTDRVTDGTTDEATDGTVYVVGGGAVYEAFLDRATELRITEVPETPEGDTRFPEIGEEWREIDREESGELAFVTYRRREPSGASRPNSSCR